MSAINEISKMTKIVPGNFTFYGTKDKRGITIQKLTVKNTNVKNL